MCAMSDADFLSLVESVAYYVSATINKEIISQMWDKFNISF